MAEIKSHIGVHTIPLVSARKATVKKKKICHSTQVTFYTAVLTKAAQNSKFCTFQPGIETAGFIQFTQIVSHFKTESV